MIVLVLGQMRSGTSLAASMLHALGVPAAFQMHAPIPPTYRMDWEDCHLSMLLEPLCHGQPVEGVAEKLTAHFTDRAHWARRLFESTDFAVKSPLLGLVWDAALHAAQAFPPVRIVVTQRRQADIDASVAGLFPDVEGALEANRRIRERLRSIRADVIVKYEEWLENPIGAAAVLGRMAGAIDPERVQAAADAVKERATWRR